MDMATEIGEMEMATATTMGGGTNQLVKMEKLSISNTKTRSHLGEVIPLTMPTIRSMVIQSQRINSKDMAMEAQIQEIMPTKTGTITW